jgi:GGDEF domain-containing protein
MGRKSEHETLQLLFTLQRRNMQLWAITTIVMMSLMAGLLTVTWRPAWYRAEWHGPAFLPQAMIGLVVLVVLLSGYLFDQKRRAAGVERSLFGEVLSSGGSGEFFDEETHTFQRRFLDYAVAQEKSVAAREGTPSCAVLIRVLRFIPNMLRGKEGSEDGFMRNAGYLLRRTFRGSDTLVRESETSFLVLMSDTTSEEARCGLNRLMETVNNWNVSSGCNYELVLSWQLVGCTPEEDLAVAVQMLRSDCLEEDKLEQRGAGNPALGALAGSTI